VGLQETSGRAIQLKVELTSFAAKEGAANYSAGGEFEPDAHGSRTKEVSIQGNQVLAVLLVIQNIDGGGEYTGTLHISADRMSPIAKRFTLVLREPRRTASNAGSVGLRDLITAKQVKEVSIVWPAVGMRSPPSLGEATQIAVVTGTGRVRRNARVNAAADAHANFAHASARFRPTMSLTPRIASIGQRSRAAR
jgi:hypothetical protein